MSRPDDATIYLDNNASTPIDPEVRAAVVDALDVLHANPSSAHHAFGREAATVLARSRARVAEVLDARAHDVVFTSGATEALNLALQGLQPRRVLVNVTEHKAVLEVCRWMRQVHGTDVVRLPVDRHGVVPRRRGCRAGDCSAGRIQPSSASGLRPT